jgi:hypothetical protein
MRRRMHAPVREQHRWLCQMLRGHYRYYGVIFNSRALRALHEIVSPRADRTTVMSLLSKMAFNGRYGGILSARATG